MAQCMVEPEFPKEKWQRQVDGLCRSLGLSSEKLAGSLKASAERFQELTRILGLPAPTEFAEHAGKKEAEPFQGEEGNNDSQVEPPISDQPSDTLDTEVHNLQFLLQVVEEIHQAIAAQSPIHQTIMMILEGIFRCIGFDRVVCCMVDPQRTLVSGRFGLGEKVEQLIPLLRAPLSSESNALTRAVRDRQDYVVDPGSRPEDRTLMEEDYWRGSDTQMFLVSPVHVGKTPVGALYADRCTSRHPITDPERQRFQSFRDLAVIAIRLSSAQGINS
jgi:transcriptional regulator with GAF, ATPase, and Fis domain